MTTGEGLRRPHSPRHSELAERPVRERVELRDEKRSIEDRLLGLVAFDPHLVEEMNVLLDELTLNAIDHSVSRTARAEKKATAAAYAQALIDVRADWVNALPLDQAIRRAAGEIRGLVPRGGDEDVSGQKAVDRAMTNLAAAYERWLAEQVASGGLVGLMRERVVALLRAQARNEKGRVSRVLNRAADKVQVLALDDPRNWATPPPEAATTP